MQNQKMPEVGVEKNNGKRRRLRKKLKGKNKWLLLVHLILH
jgi:hypothetical protein